MPTSISFPELATQRLHLVELTEEHIPDMFCLLTDKRVTETYHVMAFEKESDLLKVIEMFRKGFENGTTIRWGIVLKETNQYIGVIGFSSVQTGEHATLIYALNPKKWGKGYITEAIECISQYAFDNLHVKQISADVLPGNIASEKVLEKNGFMHQGLIPGGMQWNGAKYDVNKYVLSKG